MMSNLPSSLELETLSDSELMERITAAAEAIQLGKTLIGDDSDEQQLYRSLMTDQKRRQAAASTG